jgi:hypothetical protein
MSPPTTLNNKLMKSKRIPVGQFILDSLGETDDSYEYVQELAPSIGETIIWFNTLESDIDYILCKFISDRSDQKGLLVVASMMYATKLDLFERLTKDLLRTLENDPDWFPQLMIDLRECGVLRNKVVHANWMHTDTNGYTQVKIKVGKCGLEHELIQFSKESLDLIISKIEKTRSKLDLLNVEYLP